MKLLHLLAALAGLLFAALASAQAPQPLPEEIPLSPEQSARYERFTHELRCLVCQNQTIAESQAPLAMDLREQVKKQIYSGKSDKDVIDYLTARYGDYVLYRPPFKAVTALLWLGPFLLVGLGLLLARRYARSTVAEAPATAPAADPVALQKLLNEYQAAPDREANTKTP